MKCQACGDREATIHEVVISGSKRVERHLCEACAQKAGLGPQPALTQALSQFLVAQGKTKEAAALAAGGGAGNGVCATCGTTWASFRESGLLGCPDCYTAFESILGPMIERAHEGGTHHVGKIPHRRFSAGPVRRAVGTGADETSAEASARAAVQGGKGRVEASAAGGASCGGDAGRGGDAAAGVGGAGGLDLATIAQREAALKRQLGEAVEAEQYERAAKLRDQIKRLAEVAARVRARAVKEPGEIEEGGGKAGDSETKAGSKERTGGSAERASDGGASEGERGTDGGVGT